MYTDIKFHEDYTDEPEDAFLVSSYDGGEFGIHSAYGAVKITLTAAQALDLSQKILNAVEKWQGDEAKVCPDCDGNGSYSTGIPAFERYGDSCPRCDGTGEVLND